MQGIEKSTTKNFPGFRKGGPKYLIGEKREVWVSNGGPTYSAGMFLSAKVRTGSSARRPRRHFPRPLPRCFPARIDINAINDLAGVYCCLPSSGGIVSRATITLIC